MWMVIYLLVLSSTAQNYNETFLEKDYEFYYNYRETDDSYFPANPAYDYSPIPDVPAYVAVEYPTNYNAYDSPRTPCVGKSKMDCELVLREDLFREYQTITKPSEMPGYQIEVHLDLVLDQILELSQTESKIQVRITVKQWWTDARLLWNQTEYNGIEYIHVDPEELWTPEIILYNNIDGQYLASLSDAPALLEWNGTVHWNPPSIYSANCNIRVTQFPYDTQACTLMFKSWVYDYPEISLTPVSQKPNTDKLKKHIEWDVTNAIVWQQSVPEWTPEGDKNVTYVCYTLFLSRLPLYYTCYIIVPSIVITGLIIVVFHLPNIGGEKITLSISTLLALTFFLTLVSSITPKTSYNVPLISKFLLFSMTLVAMSVMSSVFVANIHHRTPQTHKFPKWCRKIFLDVLPRYILMERPSKEKPTFPVGYRFSIDKEQMANYANKPPSDVLKKSLKEPPRFGSLEEIDIGLISGSKAMRDIDSEDSTSLLIKDVRDNLAECAIRSSEARQHTSRRQSSVHGSQSSLHGRSRKISRQSKIMAGISIDRIIYSNRIIRMIADHEKEEDEIMSQADDWIFFALIIDRILLVIFVLVILLGSFGLFFRFMFHLKAVDIFEEVHYSRYKQPTHI